MKKTIAFTVLSIWFIFGIYVGVAGLIYGEQKKQVLDIVHADAEAKEKEKIMFDGIPFSTMAEIESYRRAIKLDSTFGWLNNVPELLILVMTSCAMGAFGGLIRIIRQITYEDKIVEETKYLSLPFLGLLLGMIVLGISYLLPTILTVNDDIQISETSLIFFSLFAGLFSESFLKWLEIRSQSFLNKNK